MIKKTTIDPLVELQRHFCDDVVDCIIKDLGLENDDYIKKYGHEMSAEQLFLLAVIKTNGCNEEKKKHQRNFLTMITPERYSEIAKNLPKMEMTVGNCVIQLTDFGDAQKQIEM
jgi:hypothetical protein